jgi:flagellin
VTDAGAFALRLGIPKGSEMAFSLNHVQASVHAKRELALGQTAMANAVQRLSSGLRMNKAADDAAGMGISEQIRSQVGGLGQSVRNANQAISMVQAADGSLNQVTDMLRRMKELATQARNGSLSMEQRRAISQEIATLRSGINASAEQATFNTNSLLKNSLGSAIVSSFFDRTQLAAGASILNGLTVENLDVFSANAGDYSISFSTPTAISNQKSRATTKLDGTEGVENSQAATVTGSGTSEAVITLSGIYEAGDQIRFTAKGDNPDRTLVQTYTVTAENLTANNDGLSAVVAGNSVSAYTNIAAGMAAQYNAANAVGMAADVDSDGSGGKDGKFSKPNAVATAGTVRFFGNNVNGSALTAVTVGAQTFNRQDYARTIIPTVQDLGEGNRIALTVNGKTYGYVVASDSTTETVAEGLRRQLEADYPATAVRAGSIVTLESDSGRTIADLSYQVYRPLDTEVVSNVASSVSPVAFTSNASRFITINDFDVIAGRRFTVDVGNPENYTQFSLIAGTDDSRVTVAAKLAAEIGQLFGSGGAAVSASNGAIQFNSALGMGMSNIQLTVGETVAGDLNPKVKPAQGITAAVWGVGGRLDDGYYDILFNDNGYAYTDPRAWTFLSSAVPGSASFNGSVLTTSPGNAVNVTLTGTPKPGDRIQFRIGPPEFGIGEPDASVTQANGQIYNSTRAVTGAGGLTGIDATYSISYLGGSSWGVTGEPAGVTGYYDQASNTLRLDTSRSVVWDTSQSYAGDTISFTSNENYDAISVTRTRSAGTSGISGSAYDLWGGDYQAYFNGSSWSLISGGPAGTYIDAATNIMHTPGKYSVQLVFSGSLKEGDRINFHAHDTGSGSNDYVSFLSSTNDFASRVETMSGVPLQAGSYLYVFNGATLVWDAQGATPSSSVSGIGSSSTITSTGTKSLEIFRYRGADESGPTATRTPLPGDYMTVAVSGATTTATYERPEGVTNTTFAVVGGLPAGDYLLEYNGATGAGAFNYTIKNAYGDSVLAATYASGWLTLDTGDQVELNLTGTPKVGDKVYFTITPGNVITDRLVEGSNIGGLETSVSSQNRDRSDRVITIQQADLAVGRAVEVAFGGREYAVKVESTDNAASVAYRLAGLIAEDYPNNTSTNHSPEFPAATRVTVSGNQITLQEPAKVGIDDIAVTVREIANPGVMTVTAMANTGIVGKSQSQAVGEIAAGASKTFRFDDFGFSFALKNSRFITVNDDSFSAYVSPVTTLSVGSLRQAATVQLGASASAGEQTSITGFKDVRITGANQNAGSDKVAFDQLANLLDAMNEDTEAALSESNFSQLQNFLESVIDRVSRFRTGLGAQQQRLEYAISNLEGVSDGLMDAQSRLQDVDYASEMARLVRMQIGQQAASAMLAQGNLLPEVILSMLQVPEAA